MKAYSNGLIVLLFFLLSLGRDEPELPDPNRGYAPNAYSAEDLTIVDSITGATLKLGMTREEIERLYEKDEEPTFPYENYEGLGVFFRDDVAASFRIAADDNASSRFKTARGIGLGSGKKDVAERYGLQYAFDDELSGGSTSLTYRLAETEDAMEALDEKAQLWNYDQEHLYAISFGFFDSKNEPIFIILIGDWKSIFQMS
ncbi:hypothetical protein [Cohnella cellulosilytica]|uniref:CAP domain-containing protein n=1 Tax=Cohnella cellulosilytica TaxID=986710 RepID=A0ABW2F1F5_9BACL